MSNVKSSQYFILDFQNKLNIPRWNKDEQQLPSHLFRKSKEQLMLWTCSKARNRPLGPLSPDLFYHDHPFSATSLLNAESA